MSYQSIYNYCRDVSQNLGVSVKWVHEGKEYLNLIEPNQGVTCWSLPFSSSGTKTSLQPMYRNWTLVFIFYQQDNLDSNLDQNDVSKMQDSIKTLSITDSIAENFVHVFEDNSINEDMDRYSDELILNSWSTEASIQETAQVLTGTILNISVSVPSDYNYCCDG